MSSRTIIYLQNYLCKHRCANAYPELGFYVKHFFVRLFNQVTSTAKANACARVAELDNRKGCPYSVRQLLVRQRVRDRSGKARKGGTTADLERIARPAGTPPNNALMC